MAAPRAGPPVDGRVRAALAASHLRDLPDEIVAELLDGARLTNLRGGRALHRAGDDVRHVELVVRGLVRVHVSAPDGRTLTVRYCRIGALMGILSLYGEPFVMPATTQAVLDAELLVMKPAVVRRLTDRDARVANALLRELSERAAAFAAEIGGSAFASVRQRVARHLLDLASDRAGGAALVATISQQELADAVGTVREVVVRTLREMRGDGLVETGRAGIAIRSPEGLLAEAYPVPGPATGRAGPRATGRARPPATSQARPPAPGGAGPAATDGAGPPATSQPGMQAAGRDGT
jgi:CRP/FNR family transcriptional regulator, cyclic AMP receptor protein